MVAGVKMTSPLVETKHTYVRLAIIIHCQILALFQVCECILRNWESLCDYDPCESGWVVGPSASSPAEN